MKFLSQEDLYRLSGTIRVGDRIGGYFNNNYMIITMFMAICFFVKKGC